MALTKLVFRPGINRETTAYGNEGGWWDCDLVRFRASRPESIGGWTKFTTAALQGTGRALMPWTALDGTIYTAVGTNLKYYVVWGSVPQDITPIRATTAPGDVTFTATSGSSTLVVSDVAHGANTNDFVTFSGAVGLGGNVTATILNKEYQITEIINADSYKVVMSVTANASATGHGGTNTVGAYQMSTGLNTTVFGTGWGVGPWSRGGWSSSSASSGSANQLRTWSQDNFGEDLIFCAHDGGIYYWDTSLGVATRAVALSSLAGANMAPTVAKQVLVSERDRHVIAFGCDPEADPGVQDPLTIRFSDQENPADWETTALTTAGELRLGSGSEIICAVQTKQQVAVFTDCSLHAMQYIGEPYTFGIQEVSSSISIMGPNAAVSVGDTVFWMGLSEFYTYSGAVSQIPCDVKEYVFSGINIEQRYKVCSGHNSAFSEVWWFYPSEGSSENDKYVVFNYEQRLWYYGSLPRTAWYDRGTLINPVSISPDGYVYYQEYGLNDGSTNPPSALPSFIESSVVDLGEGDQFMFASRIIPDLTFRNSTANDATVTMTLKARNYPGDPYSGNYANTVTKTASVPVEQYTDQVFVRLRGRSMSLRVDSSQTNVSWRLGDPRLDVRPDGRR